MVEDATEMIANELSDPAELAVNYLNLVESTMNQSAVYANQLKAETTRFNEILDRNQKLDGIKKAPNTSEEVSKTLDNIYKPQMDTSTSSVHRTDKHRYLDLIDKNAYGT